MGDTYKQLFKIKPGLTHFTEIDLFGEKLPVVETIRQWLLIFLCTTMTILCVRAVYRVYTTQRALNKDSMLIALEGCKVLPLLHS